MLFCFSAPYNPDSTSLESTVISYWVMPPPEMKPNEYSKSMLMNYSVVQDQFLSQDALNEMVSHLEILAGFFFLNRSLEARHPYCLGWRRERRSEEEKKKKCVCYQAGDDRKVLPTFPTLGFSGS